MFNNKETKTPNTNSFATIELEWDTEYFGLNCAKSVLNKELCTWDRRQLLEDIIKYDFVTIVNKNNNYRNNQWLGSNTRSFLTDINIQFVKKIGEIEEYNTGDNVEISDVILKNEDICNIARTSFVFSRFFNDPNLDIKKSREIYIEWVHNAFEKKGKYFVISRINNQISGFLLFSIEPILSSAVIELLAVDNKFKGKRIGKTLMNKLDVFLKGEDIKQIKVGTQVDNSVAINFYRTCGFENIGCNSIYHYWPNLRYGEMKYGF